MSDLELQQSDKLLLSLQDVLREKFALENEIEALPLDLKALEERLTNANKKYLELTEKYTRAKEEATSNAIRYDEAFNDRNKSESMMDQVTTQREYEALLKQIEEAKIREKGLLNARTASQNLVEELKSKLEIQGTECDTIKAEVDAKSSEIDSIILEKKEHIAALDRECDNLKAQGITDEIFTKFSNIVKNKKGVGIVPIHGQVCQGCHMILPIQFVNDVRLNNETQYCPYCSRILYYEESADDFIDLSSIVDSQDDESLADSVDSSDFDDLL